MSAIQGHSTAEPGAGPDRSSVQGRVEVRLAAALAAKLAFTVCFLAALVTFGLSLWGGCDFSTAMLRTAAAAALAGILGRVLAPVLQGLMAQTGSKEDAA